jgi:hypothetical protein
MSALGHHAVKYGQVRLFNEIGIALIIANDDDVMNSGGVAGKTIQSQSNPSASEDEEAEIRFGHGDYAALFERALIGEADALLWQGIFTEA